PVVVAVAMRHVPHPKAVEPEDLLAVAAGVENLLLAAHALGLGAMWRTGEAAHDPRPAALFGLGPRDPPGGLVYPGYRAAERPPTARAPAAEFAAWRGWED